MIIDNINEKSLKKLETYYFNKSNLSNIIIDLIKNDTEVSKYLFDHSFIDKETLIANYSFTFKNLDLNIKKIKELSRETLKKIDYENKYLFVNLYILHVIIHEIEHVKQNYLINETDNELKDLLLLELLSSKNKKTYRYYYNYYALESDAQSTALENVLKLAYQIDDIYLYNYYKNLLFKRLTKNYKNDTYPNYIISNKVLHTDPFLDSTLDTYDKCKYGLFLEKNEYKNLVLNYDDIIKEKIIKK